MIDIFQYFAISLIWLFPIFCHYPSQYERYLAEPDNVQEAREASENVVVGGPPNQEDPPRSGIEKDEADSVQEAGMEIENILAGSSKKGGNSLVFCHEGEGWTVMQSPRGTMV